MQRKLKMRTQTNERDTHASIEGLLPSIYVLYPNAAIMPSYSASRILILVLWL
jgi:hypothetical protein